MNINYKKWAIAILFVILAYIMGLIFPTEFLKPKFSDNDILNKAEYYRTVIAIISAFITFCAMIVALFKEDFREHWKRPKIAFVTPNNLTIEEFTSQENENSNSERLVIANKYISRMEVINEGNLPALNAEIYLEKLNFTPKNSTIEQNIETTSTALKWNGSNTISIIIPPGGKKLIKIVEITCPENYSTPDSKQITKPSNITIGDIKGIKEHEKGIWKAKFNLYAQNHKPISFEIEIEWDGVWQNRFTEFKNHYKLTKK